MSNSNTYAVITKRKGMEVAKGCDNVATITSRQKNEK